jgi:hypothetical protein
VVRGGLVCLVGAFALVYCAVGCVSAGAHALGEDRTYEMVSPPYKGGYGAQDIGAVAPNGDSVMFYSAGTFAGAPSPTGLGFDYFASRDGSSWSTAPVLAPVALLPYENDKDVSPTLDSVLVLGKPGANQEGAFQTGREEELLLHSTHSPDTPGNWELAGAVFKTFPEEPIELRFVDASPDFCHVIITPATGINANLTPEEPSVKIKQPYELVRGCAGEPAALRRIALNNSHKAIAPDPSCYLEIGLQNGIEGTVPSTFNAVAAAGKEIFFTTCGAGGSSGSNQLFVRLDGSRTLEVSKPTGEGCSEVPCAGGAKRTNAYFVGASEDGSVVFFTTTSALDPATDKDSGNDLYMARIGCPTAVPDCEVSQRVVTSLVQASRDPNGGEARLQGVMRLAPDGSRVYFVAGGDLLGEVQQKALEGEGHSVPHEGADNLYVYDDRSGQVGFVADLCFGKALSGAVADPRCPSETGLDESLWRSTGEAQTAGSDGRFLVFATYAQLVRTDTDAAKDVYRYDAATGSLERVSIGEHGYDANGNNNAFDASITPGFWGYGHVYSQYELNTRAISEDGSRIVFTSSETLSPAVSNYLANLYVWKAPENGSGEGSVSLISSGNAEQPVERPVISVEGNDVFFVTAQGLVPQDTDGAADIYDARVHGGFAVEPGQPEPCVGDACEGPLTNPTALLVPGSISQEPGGNLAASANVKRVAVKKKVKRKKAKRKTKRTTRGKK